MLVHLAGISLLSALAALIVALAPPDPVTVRDAPHDAGNAINVAWTIPAADSVKPTGFRVLRSTAPDSGYIEVALEPAFASEYMDAGTRDGIPYYYRVVAIYPGDSAASTVIGPVKSSAQWFRTPQANVLVLLVIICTVFAVYFARARRGAKMFVRKIAGLDAIDDALGRATEMGKPILFSFGLGYITDMVVMAALPLLRRIAGKSAQYSTRLLVPNSDPIVMTAAQETVKEAYTEAGRPDFYNADYVNFLTSDQFGYAAGVDGIIVREKPGAIFWLGYFYAESLIMAETGHSVGAIQLAGTTETTQLPFFVAACDYTLIGEEIFAASCYLKPEPMMLGSLKGEDFLKAGLILVTLVIVALGTVAAVGRIAGLQKIVDVMVRLLSPAY
jgi:hypothetical protein